MQLTLYSNKIWLFRTPIDFRKSIDGLCHIISQDASLKPTRGIFIFYNKKRDKIKCLSWHKNGFVLLYKKLERSRFIFSLKKLEGKMVLTTDEFGWLLAGLDWHKMRDWQELNYDKFN